MSVTSSLSDSLGSDEFERLEFKERRPDIRRDCIVCRDVETDTAPDPMTSKLLEMIYLHSAHVDFCLREKIDEGEYHMASQDYIAVSLFQNFYTSLQIVMQSCRISRQPDSEHKKKGYTHTNSNAATESAKFHKYVATKFLAEKDVRRPPSFKRGQKVVDAPQSITKENETRKGSLISPARPSASQQGLKAAVDAQTSVAQDRKECVDSPMKNSSTPAGSRSRSSSADQPSPPHQTLGESLPFTTYNSAAATSSQKKKKKAASKSKESYQDDNSPLVDLAAAAASETKYHRKINDRRAERARSVSGEAGSSLLTAANLASSTSRAMNAGRDELVVETERPGQGNSPGVKLDVCECAREGDIEKLRTLIDEGDGREVLMRRDGSNMNALDHACAAGQLEVMRELILLCGIDANSANDVDGYTALHHACSSGSLQAVTFLLLVANVEENPRGFDGFTPFDVAATKEIRKLLLSRRSTANRKLYGRSASVSNLSPAVSEALLSSPSALSPSSPLGPAFKRIPPSPSTASPKASEKSPAASAPGSKPLNRRASAPNMMTGQGVVIQGSLCNQSHSSDDSESGSSSSPSEGGIEERVSQTKSPLFGSSSSAKYAPSSKAAKLAAEPILSGSPSWKDRMQKAFTSSRSRSASEDKSAKSEGSSHKSEEPLNKKVQQQSSAANVVETAGNSSGEDDDTSPSGRKIPQGDCETRESLAL